MTNYPIIEQRKLSKASRRGPMGIAPPRRQDGDLPLTNAHEVVVYKSAGAYIVDDGRSRNTDDHVVNATNVTVVDMREDAPVTVQATIPSAGASEFVVHVTFLCTVRKPEEVVEAGLQDITGSLTNYLTRHQRLFHLGEDYHLDQVTAVRHNVTAEIKAYFSARPHRIRGLDVKLGNIQVMTPDELRAKQRERELEGMLTSEQQQMEHRLAQQKAELEETRRKNEEEFELERRRHEQELALMQQKLARIEKQFEQQQDQQRLTHERIVRTESFVHAADEAARLQTALGADDSELPTILAGAIGERSVSEMTDSLNADRKDRQERNAEAALRRDEWQREKARYERDLAHENSRMGYDLEVARLKTQADVVVAAVNRGLADHQNIEYLMSELQTVAKQLERAAATTPQQETDQGESPDRSERQGGPKHSNVPADERVIEGQVITDDSDDRGDDGEPEPREEDLGR